MLYWEYINSSELFCQVNNLLDNLEKYFIIWKTIKIDFQNQGKFMEMLEVFLYLLPVLLYE